jgi:hypothetical protein
LDENTVGYTSSRDVVEALDRLTSAVRDHAVVTALAGFEAHAINKFGVQLALALRDDDDERATALRTQARGLFR